MNWRWICKQFDYFYALQCTMKTVDPLGKSPVITDDGATVAESGAIVEYLVDKHGAGRLVRPRRQPAEAHRFLEPTMRAARI